ncbi:hypothetical protein ACTU3I_13815 [Microbacterium sp. RD1]|uniref:hypothetical protein n=1 Tax=Microbacterium sp. RD1 TaxID=3457313 RepID=UPI003FA59A42
MKSLRLRIAAVLVATGALTAIPLAANAYPPSQPSPSPTVTTAPGGAVVGSSTVAPGGTVTVAFSGFQPNEQVTFFLSGENASGARLAAVQAVFQSNVNLGTRAADGSGAVTVRVVLPSNASGTYTLTADGAVSPNVSTTFSVAGGLPPTGIDAASMTGVWIGGGALLAAGIAVTSVAVIRRRQAEQA